MPNGASTAVTDVLTGLVGRLRPLPGWLVSRAGLAMLAALAVAGMISLAPPIAGATPKAMTAIGLAVFIVAMWASVTIPQHTASLIFLTLVVATGTATSATALAGFTSSSLWLVFGGFLIGTAADRSGFGRYIARHFLGGFAGSYGNLILGVLIGTTILSFLVPASMGRIAITVPVMMALAREAGYEEGSPGYNGLMLTAVVGNFGVALAILPANLLNIMITGSGDALYGVRFAYVQYLWLCGPVLGLAKAALVWATVVWLFPAPKPARGEPGEAERLSPAAKRVAVILAGAIAMWATDFWHGIRPGWIALGAGLVCLLPGLGLLQMRDLLDPRKLLITIWVGTVLALGPILTASGASSVISHALAGVSGVAGQSPLYGYFAIAILASLMCVAATAGAGIPIVSAAAGDIAALTGLPIATAVLSITAGASALFFPYETAPVVVGLALGRVGLAPATRFMVTASLLTWILLLPLNALWWRFAGILP